MATTTYLITGASRGLGLEFTRQLLAGNKNARVIAAARDPAKATLLQELIKAEPGRIETLKLDVSDAKSIETAASEISKLSFAKDGIDVLLNNAGVLEGGWNSALKGSIEELEGNMKVNVYGVILTTKAFLPVLRQGKGKGIWTVSSLVGSIGGSFSQAPNATMYAVSKAAINMYMKKLSTELAAEDFTVLLLHPGYVTTDMNGGKAGSAEIHVEESIEKSLKTLLSKTSKQNGTFWNYEGDELPW